jgi:hypothetical protein
MKTIGKPIMYVSLVNECKCSLSLVLYISSLPGAIPLNTHPPMDETYIFQSPRNF